MIISDPAETPFGSSVLRWTASTGAQSIGFITRDPAGSEIAIRGFAGATNADGSVIVGAATFNFFDGPFPPYQRTVPFMWDAVHGARAIAASDGTYPNAFADDVTPDGSVFVGFLTDTNSRNTLVRWSMATGYQFIPTPLPVTGEPHVRTSADGNAVVADLNYWSPSTGAITIQQLLTQSGCNFTGWTITGAVGISDDGRTIAGNGTSPTGQTQAWIATVPSPGGGLVVAAALAYAARRKRQYTR